jgi:CubicO group peptidase (beta-lactamase class C family)/D-alanyl-D-alanine dipeptidase
LKSGFSALLPAAPFLAGIVAASPGHAQDSIPAGPAYAAAAQALTARIEQARTEHAIPGISIALVAEGRVVWAHGFGWADSAAARPATAQTLYPAGSISKPLTALALMMLVQRGQLSLDTPVAALLPGVAPGATLRHLLAHRSGLQREPPVGHYFDTTSPPLSAVAGSLRGRAPVFAPGTRFKYSNAAYAVAGTLLETAVHEPFAAWLRREVLRPLGMPASGFALADIDTLQLARGLMVTAEGRTLGAPRFDAGTLPATNLITNVLDLGHMTAALLQRAAPIPHALLDSMWRPQFGPSPVHGGYGLGFRIGALDGIREVGHAGVMNGFVGELALLPERGVGAVVLANRDLASGVTEALADDALRALLGSLAAAPHVAAVPDSFARTLVGRWAAGADTVFVRRRDSSLVLDRFSGIARTPLREVAGQIRTYGALQLGTRITPIDSGSMVIDAVPYTRVADLRPRAAPERWRGLLGEYGPAFNVAHLLEEQGRLALLLGGAFRMPLRELGRDTFALPPGLLDGERVVFARAADGRATHAEVGGVVLPRRAIDGEAGATFRIRPRRPVESLRAEALASMPPEESGTFRPSDLVELRSLDATIRYDIRYATENNFMGAVFYSSAHAFLQRPAADAVARASARLRQLGYGLLIHDAYRPWYVTRMFWDATPVEQRDFVADPARGSRHNRGAAVDLSLYHLANGQPVEMVSGYDEFSPRAYPEYPGGTSLQRWHRELLRSVMESEGFTVYPAEWWHFDHADWRHYRIGNQAFEDLER